MNNIIGQSSWDPMTNNDLMGAGMNNKWWVLAMSYIANSTAICI